MTFREKSAAVTLAVIAFVYGGYFWRLGDWRDLPTIDAVDAGLIGTVIGLCVLLIFAQILLSVLTTMAGEDTTEDERDRTIALIGDRNGGYVAAAGATAAMLALLREMGAVQVVHLLLLALVLSEVAKLATQLVLYRRGV